MSSVWQFFTVSLKDPKNAICNACKQEVSRGGHSSKHYNTTNLIRHLRNRHVKEFGEYETQKLAAQAATSAAASPSMKLKQTTVLAALQSNEPYRSDSKKAKEITKKVMEFIGLDEQPLSVVQDAGFTRLLTHLEPRYKIPGRKYFTDVALPELYQTLYNNINTLLQSNVSKISFTSDIWSSSVSPMSMLSLTAQWINENFELKQAVLHSQEFSGSHTAAALAGAFNNMLESWNIPKDRVHVILRDNAQNMAKGMKDAGLPSLGCMAHSLQLVVKEGLLSQRAIRDILAMGRRIVGHFKHSPLSYSRLQDIQKQLGQPLHRLQQDVETRWNSSFYMLQSLLEQKCVLLSYAADYDLPCTYSASQWKLMENIVSLLTPFEELTRDISSSTASAADVIPAIMALTRLLETSAETDQGVKTAKETLLEALRKRFSLIESEPLYVLATVLDPR